MSRVEKNEFDLVNRENLKVRAETEISVQRMANEWFSAGPHSQHKT